MQTPKAAKSLIAVAGNAAMVRRALESNVTSKIPGLNNGLGWNKAS